MEGTNQTNNGISCRCISIPLFLPRGSNPLRKSVLTSVRRGFRDLSPLIIHLARFVPNASQSIEQIWEIITKFLLSGRFCLIKWDTSISAKLACHKIGQTRRHCFPSYFFIAALFYLPIVNCQNTTFASTFEASSVANDTNPFVGDNAPVNQTQILASSLPTTSPIFNTSQGNADTAATSAVDTEEVIQNEASISGDNSNFTAEAAPPSFVPSQSPSMSTVPSTFPSFYPTALPTYSPSETPSMTPTFNISIPQTANFLQKFTLEGSKFFNDSEILLFQSLMENYTDEAPINPDEPNSVGRVTTICEILDQKSTVPPLTVAPAETVPPDSRRLRASLFVNNNSNSNITNLWRSVGRSLFNQSNSSNPWRRSLQSTFVNTVSYKLTYASNSINVSEYPTLFEVWINENLDKVTLDLNNLGMQVIDTEDVSRFFTQTPEPTISPRPSSSPTQTATMTSTPTSSPTGNSTASPTGSSTTSIHPSYMPSEIPSEMPSEPPSSSSSSNTVLIVVIVVVVASVLMFGLFFYYRRQKALDIHHEMFGPADGSVTGTATGVESKRGDLISHAGVDANRSIPGGKGAPPKAMNSQDLRMQYNPDGRVPLPGEGLVSPSESLVSNQSLLSAGISMGGDSGDEADTTQNLQDEFDKYKDQNLEKMREEVEGSLSNFDGMMSHALTKALMDDEDDDIDTNELSWGGDVGHQTGAEIEASALCEVTDWLKRNDNVSIDRKRNFMQEMLNKMVSSVRHGILGPDDASRAIHECAAMLNLQLATELPVTTVIITGMRKMVSASDVIEAFREFGEIDDAAVASNQRGFGLVRYKTPKSVDRAMRKFTLEEIVVQDVAVQVRVLPNKGGDGQWRSASQASKST